MDNENVNANKQQKISDIVISNENEALNVLVTFCNLAQQRGAYNLEESAKIWECIQIFKKTNNADDNREN
jgi:hypothetical protein|tara:strand:+ start:518 stop:727 length:210 start_codon:yes stop_codon:yes gene_type:complete